MCLVLSDLFDNPFLPAWLHMLISTGAYIGLVLLIIKAYIGAIRGGAPMLPLYAVIGSSGEFML